MKLLSPKQRTALAQIARRAWKPLHDSGAIEETFDAWRHRIATQVCGHTLSTAPAKAFDDLFIEFKAQAGQTEEAFDRANSTLPNDSRQLLFLIDQALEAGGFTRGYALAIARNLLEAKVGRVLETYDSVKTLPTAELRTLLIKITQRTAAKKRQAKA